MSISLSLFTTLCTPQKENSPHSAYYNKIFTTIPHSDTNRPAVTPCTDRCNRKLVVYRLHFVWAHKWIECMHEFISIYTKLFRANAEASLWIVALQICNKCYISMKYLLNIMLTTKIGIRCTHERSAARIIIICHDTAIQMVLLCMFVPSTRIWYIAIRNTTFAIWQCCALCCWCRRTSYIAQPAQYMNIEQISHKRYAINAKYWDIIQAPLRIIIQLLCNKLMGFGGGKGPHTRWMQTFTSN